MFWQKSAIQAVPSACSRYPPVGSGALRSKTPMLSSPRKPPSKTLLPSRSLRFTHQVKLSRSFWNARSSQFEVPLAAPSLVDRVREDRGPGVHRRVDVAEVPLVRGNLPAGVEVLVPQHQVQLVLAEVLVDERQRKAVEGQVPRRVPRVLPLVRHGDYVGVVHVVPVVVAGAARRPALNGSGAVLLEPPVDVVVVELLGPEHAGQRLAHHVGRIGVER